MTSEFVLCNGCPACLSPCYYCIGRTDDSTLPDVDAAECWCCGEQWTIQESGDPNVSVTYRTEDEARRFGLSIQF